MHTCFRYAKLFCHFSAACFTILHECESNSLDVFVGSDGRQPPTSLLVVHIFSPPGEAVIPAKHVGTWHHGYLVGCLQQLVCFCHQKTGWKTKFKRISHIVARDLHSFFIYTKLWQCEQRSVDSKSNNSYCWPVNTKLGTCSVEGYIKYTQNFIEIAPLVTFWQRLSY